MGTKTVRVFFYLDVWIEKSAKGTVLQIGSPAIPFAKLFLEVHEFYDPPRHPRRQA
jgi:hypothetical protein